MITIRRIEEQDGLQEFSTGKRTFDFDPDGKSLDLRFYLERDRSGDYESYVLVDNRTVMGVLCIQRCGDFLYLSRVGVRKGYWRRGYGTELMRFAVSKAIENRYFKVTLESDEENVDFYLSFGFKVIRKYYDDYWGSSATMELTLRF